MSLPAKLRAGVTLYVRKGTQSLWENGIYQNCLFLVQLLQASPVIEQVYLICGGDGDAEDRRRFVASAPCPLLDMAEAAEIVDLAFEMSAGLNKEWVARLRERGGKVISYYVGNDFVLDAERMVFDLPNAWLVPDSPRDAVWTLEEYRRTCAPYYQAAVRSPVAIMPHLWSPELFDRAAREAGLIDEVHYRPGERRWRIGVAEPNLSYVKTYLIPLLACECAHRADPNMLEHVWMFNTLPHLNKAPFSALANSLDLVQHGVASFEGRVPAYEVFAKLIDALVCHQWENAQNYIYYEALHCGFPLIHKSPLLGDCGYRYHDFDCEEAARALRQAYDRHDLELSHYRDNARAYIARLAPHYAGNVALYTEEIRRIVA